MGGKIILLIIVILVVLSMIGLIAHSMAAETKLDELNTKIDKLTYKISEITGDSKKEESKPSDQMIAESDCDGICDKCEGKIFCWQNRLNGDNK